MASHRIATARRIVAATGLFISVGCTQTLDFEECRDDLDCMNLQGLDLICGEANECIPRPAPNEVACSVNSDCAVLFDQDHVCGPAGSCVPLLSDACTLVGRADDADPDQVVYFGSLLPTSPPFDTTIGPIQNAVVLAAEDFNARAELPGGKSVGWVACDTAGSASRATAAASHLVDAGVQALVGPAFSESTLAVAQDVAIENDVFVISPTASNKAITDLDDSGLVWRTIGSDVYQASALADRLAALDPPARRILILAKDDAYGTTLSQDFLDRAQEVVPDGQYGMLRYPDPATFSNAEQLLAAYGDAVAMGYAHSADTVVLIGTNEVRDIVLFYLLVREGEEPPPPLPRFIASHGAVPILTAIVESDDVSPGFRPTLMAALEGVSPIIQNETNFNFYNARYRVRFQDQEPLSASSLGYDAAMVTILAMVAAGDGADGVDIATAVSKLTGSGPPVPFGDPDVFVPDLVAALTDGETVNVQGVSGELDFNADGEVRTNLIGWSLLPRQGAPQEPVLTPVRQYVLDAVPSESGSWMDLQ